MKILIYGKAGSGKDTFAKFLAEMFGTDIGKALIIAMADPMKRFAAKFGFSQEALWGPTEARNAPSVTVSDVIKKIAPDFPDDSPQLRMLDKFDLWRNEEGINFVSDGEEREIARRWFSDLIAEGEETFGSMLSARRFLQTFGTEFGRRINPNIWIDLAAKRADHLLASRQGYASDKGILEDSGDTRWNQAIIVTDGRFRNEILRLKDQGFKVVKIFDPTDTSKLNNLAAAHSSEAEQDSIPNSWFDVIIRNDKKQGLDFLKQLATMTHAKFCPDPLVFGRPFEPASFTPDQASW